MFLDDSIRYIKHHGETGITQRLRLCSDVLTVLGGANCVERFFMEYTSPWLDLPAISCVCAWMALCGEYKSDQN